MVPPEVGALLLELPVEFVAVELLGVVLVELAAELLVVVLPQPATSIVMLAAMAIVTIPDFASFI